MFNFPFSPRWPNSNLCGTPYRCCLMCGDGVYVLLLVLYTYLLRNTTPARSLYIM